MWPEQSPVSGSVAKRTRFGFASACLATTGIALSPLRGLPACSAFALGGRLWGCLVPWGHRLPAECGPNRCSDGGERPATWKVSPLRVVGHAALVG
eukprot:7852305-Alexandrium_andersonii.AAC.1